MKYLLTLLTFFVLTHALSQDTVLTVTIPEITVTPTGDEPITLSQYDNKFIESSSGEEPSLILSKTPSVISYSESGNYQGYAYVRLRGVDQTRINFNLDGIPLNEGEDQGAYLSNFSQFLEGVDRAQIQRGVGISPNTSSYVGSISFLSEPLFEEKKSKLRLSAGSFNTLRGSFSTKYINESKDLSLTLGASVSSGDGYRRNSHNDGGGFHIIAGKRFGNSTLKFINITGKQNNDLSWLGSLRSDIEIDRRHNQNAPSEDDEFMQSVSGLTYTNYVNDRFSYRTTGYLNYLDGNYDFNLGTFLYTDPDPDNFNFGVRHTMYGGIADFIFNLGSLELTNSYHLNTMDRRHIGSQNEDMLYTNTGTKNEFSTNVNAELDLGDFALYSDIQYRRPTFSYEGDVSIDDIEWNFLNYKAGISYKGVYYSYGRVNREPGRTDLFGGEDNLIELSDVTYETAKNHELGYRLDNFGINLYRMDFDNEIILNGQFGPNSLPIKTNVANSYRQGIEISYDQEIYNVNFGTTVNFSQNKVEQDDETFNHVQAPGRVINLYAGYTDLFGLVDLKVSYRNQSSMYLDLANSLESEGFDNIDINTSIAIGEDCSIGIDIRNVLNSEYFQTGAQNVFGEATYFVAPKRNFMTNIVCRF